MSGAVLVSRMYISIPAPARGRTESLAVALEMLPISIPAPARGRTLHFVLLPAFFGYFNSRPREGANPRMVFMRSTALFQFPPPRGGEPDDITTMAAGLHFNSRPREGANHRGRCVLASGRISIPAPARGRTNAAVKNRDGVYISIPAPARGRTEALGDRQITEIDFNSRPREGANDCICR